MMDANGGEIVGNAILTQPKKIFLTKSNKRLNFLKLDSIYFMDA